MNTTQTSKWNVKSDDTSFVRVTHEKGLARDEADVLAYALADMHAQASGHTLQPPQVYAGCSFYYCSCTNVWHVGH